MWKLIVVRIIIFQLLIFRHFWNNVSKMWMTTILIFSIFNFSTFLKQRFENVNDNDIDFFNFAKKMTLKFSTQTQTILSQQSEHLKMMNSMKQKLMKFVKQLNSWIIARNQSTSLWKNIQKLLNIIDNNQKK